MLLIDGQHLSSSRFALIASTRPTARIPGDVRGPLVSASNHGQFIDHLLVDALRYNWSYQILAARLNWCAPPPGALFVSAPPSGRLLISLLNALLDPGVDLSADPADRPRTDLDRLREATGGDLFIKG